MLCIWSHRVSPPHIRQNQEFQYFRCFHPPQAPPQQFPHAHTFPLLPCIPLSSANYTSHKHCWVTCKRHMFIFFSLPKINLSPSKYREGKQEILPFDGRLCFVCREENVPITAPIAKATCEFLERIYFGWVFFFILLTPPPPHHQWTKSM